MGVFDSMRRRKPSGGNGNSDDSSGLDLEALRREVPDVDSTADEIERALSEPMQEGTKKGGCGCWG